MMKLKNEPDAAAKSKDELDALAEVIAKDFAVLREVAASRAELAHVQATVELYARPQTMRPYLRHYSSCVMSHEENFEESEGVDYGCWFGLSTIILHRLGARKLLGFDVVPDHVNVAKAFVDALQLPGVEFALIPGTPFDRMPLEANSVDWVLAHDVYSFSRPAYFAEYTEDIARVLRPGGTFYLTDGNNPHHQPTVDRLLKHYHMLEIGDGSLQSPEGDYYKLRRDMIRAEFPSLSEERAWEVAGETVYRWGQEILDYARAAVEGDSSQLQPSLFVPDALKPPLYPLDGRAMGAPTDPVGLSELFEQKGLEPELRMGFGPGASRGNGDPDLTGTARFYLLGRKRR